MVSKGLALVALAVAIPGALGPTVAATILAVAKWPWLFLVNVPFGLAVPLFIAAAPPDVRIARPLDLTGIALNALAFGLFIAGIGTRWVLAMSALRWERSYSHVIEYPSKDAGAAGPGEVGVVRISIFA